MTVEAITFWSALICLGILMSIFHNWERASILIARELPSGMVLPKLNFLDGFLRSGIHGRNRVYAAMFMIYFMYSVIFMPWYWALLSPILLFFSVVIFGTLLPDHTSRFYKNSIRRSVARLLKSSNTPASTLHLTELVAFIDELIWPLYEAPGVRTVDREISPLTEREQALASKLTIWLVWYDDRFEWFEDEPSSFLAAVCATEQEADKMVNSRPLSDPETFDGYQHSGSSNLLAVYSNGTVSAAQVRDILGGKVRSRPNYYNK